MSVFPVIYNSKYSTFIETNIANVQFEKSFPKFLEHFPSHRFWSYGAVMIFNFLLIFDRDFFDVRKCNH